MRRTSVLASAVLAAISLGTAKATVVDDLTAIGFEVVIRTVVIGDFDGCDYDRQVMLKSGGVFTCAGFGYMHTHNPAVVLLKKKDANLYKLVVQGSGYVGKFCYG